ncbi:MAG: hypothetical protein MUC31_04300 [Bacteroidales bacterium]|nr:hypothetical protein [Bacteroidales bacterium]
MKTKIITSMISAGFLLISLVSFTQCDIKHRIYPDGSMLYYIEPVNFYWTEAKDLKGGIMTDKENYFLALQPSPYPEKDVGKKLKSDLVLKLADDKEYQFEHFDTRYLEGDSIMEMLFLINKDQTKPLQEYEVIQAKIDMEGEEGIRAYTFKLHKAALKEQLDCFLKKDEEKKK